MQIVDNKICENIGCSRVLKGFSKNKRFCTYCRMNINKYPLKWKCRLCDTIIIDDRSYLKKIYCDSCNVTKKTNRSKK